MLTICLMHPIEHPLKRGTSLMYGSYKFCEICKEEIIALVQIPYGTITYR